MSTEADKVTAELMAQIDELCGLHVVSLRKRAEIEQAIRRAVDWGEPVAAVTAHQGLRWLIGEEEAAARGGLFGQPLYARNKP